MLIMLSSIFLFPFSCIPGLLQYVKAEKVLLNGIMIGISVKLTKVCHPFVCRFLCQVFGIYVKYKH